MSLTIPSEYVSTGVGTGSELVTNGDFSDGSAGWTTQNTTISGGEAVLLSDGTRGLLNRAVSLTLGATYLIEFDVSDLTGSYIVQVRNSGGSQISGLNESAVTATGTVKYVFQHDNPSANLIFFQCNSAASGGFTLDNVSIKRIDHGVNVDGVKVFTTENGNSVASNVVTEGTGAAIEAGVGDGTLAPLGYTAEGAATELSGYSADLDNWTKISSPTVTQNAAGLDGKPNAAFTVEDNNVSDHERITITDPAYVSGTDVYYGMFRVAYEESPSVYPRLQCGVTGGTAVAEGVVLDQSDGTYVETATGGSVVSVQRIGDWWHVLLTVTDNNSANTSFYLNFAPAYNSDGSATVANATTGSTVIASAELYKTNYSLTPILTTGGTTATRVATVGATSPLALFSDAQGACEFKLTPWFDEVLSSNAEIINPNTGAVRFLYFGTGTAKRIIFYDGTIGVGNTGTYDIGETITVKMRWGNGTFRFSVIDADGNVTLAASTAYDGSFNPSGAITYFKSLTRMASIKDVVYYNADLGDGWLSV